MSESKYSLPPRKWYTLEQAAKRIAKLTGEEIEVVDLLHYWSIGKINLSVYFVNHPAMVQIGDIQIYNKDLLALHIYKDSEEDYFLEDIFSQRQKPKTEFSNEFIKFRIVFSEKIEFSDYISGFMILPCSIDTKTNADLNEAINKGVLLNTHNYLISPTEITHRRTLILFSAITEEDVYLPLNNLVILDYDLMEFLGNETKKINVYDVELEIANFGRKKDPRLQEILILGRKTFEKFPFATANKIAREVREFLVKKYSLKSNKIITANRIVEYYKANNIGAEGKAKNTKKPIQVITD